MKFFLNKKVVVIKSDGRHFLNVQWDLYNLTWMPDKNAK